MILIYMIPTFFFLLSLIPILGGLHEWLCILHGCRAKRDGRLLRARIIEITKVISSADRGVSAKRIAKLEGDVPYGSTIGVPDSVSVGDQVLVFTNHFNNLRLYQENPSFAGIYICLAFGAVIIIVSVLVAIGVYFKFRP